MAIRDTLAANLRALMDYAGDNPDTLWPASQKSLAEKTGLARATIQRVLESPGQGKEATSAAIDTVEAIAGAYGFEAWQLLFAELDPTNPPVVPVTEAEKVLTSRLKRVARELHARMEKEEPSPAPGEGSDPARPRQSQRKRTQAKRRKATVRQGSGGE